MIISDLNYLEVAQEEICGAGGVHFASTVTKTVDVTEAYKLNVDEKIKSIVDLKGNAAEAQATADAYGKDTKTITDTAAQATNYSSESFSKSIAAVG
jgi:hypothetical protein